ncbi:uncharacterized protein LOC134238261 [Saccostrea cucullata]|uniref:uncharacterized protein LOC134238261 n=1 Tax=Saccostrea cuccullata TaxID=36930 RepID=UPI002ED28FB1
MTALKGSPELVLLLISVTCHVISQTSNGRQSVYIESLGINITGNAIEDQIAITKALRDLNITLAELLTLLPDIDKWTFLNNSVTPAPKDDTGDGAVVGWGVIIPVLLIVVFLVTVTICLLWHTWINRRRTSNSTEKTPDTEKMSKRFKRSIKNTSDFVRGSTRSTTPLRSSVIENVHVTALQRQNADKFTFVWDKDNWRLCPPESRLQSSDFNNNTLRQHLSPIDESETSIANVSRTYNLSAHPPYSPYHLTYIHAPPPSYEESEVSSLGKSIPMHSLQTTNTTQSEESCSACMKQGKSLTMSSPFHPHYNTPTTECGLDEPSNIKFNSAATTNLSQYTSYPSSPMSSSAGSLTASNIDTGPEASLMMSYPEPVCPPSSLQSDFAPSANQTPEETSQNGSDFSGGIPSLPSSILYYHQQMTGDNSLKPFGKTPNFSPHAFQGSAGSSLISADTHYEDNTSLLPNVGSSNTSENPTGSLQFHTNLSLNPSLPLSNSVMPSLQNPSIQFATSFNPSVQYFNTLNPSLQYANFASSQNISAEDLSKMVDEMSSIRPFPPEETESRGGVVHSVIGYEGTVGQSYVADICAPQSGSEADNNFHQSITELFKSWSVTAELDYSSLSSHATSQRADPTAAFDHQSEHSSYGASQPTDMSSFWEQQQGRGREERDRISDDSSRQHVQLNHLPVPGRRVKFDVPILVNKTYWV